MDDRDIPWAWKSIYTTIRDTDEGFVFVLGATGVGKTYAVSTILRQLQYHVFTIDSQNCSSVKELKQLLDRQLSTNLVRQMQQDECARKVLYIDELETLVQFDRGILQTLAAFTAPRHHQNNKIMIVCTCHNSLEKKIRTVFSSASIHTYKALSETDICILLKNKHPNAPYERILHAAETCFGNISLALQTMDGAAQASKDPLSYEFDDIFNSVDIDALRNILANDPWLHPLRFHENVIKDMSRRIGSQAHKHTVYTGILERLCHWDMFMQHVDDTTVPMEYIVHTIRTLPALKKSAAPASTCEFTKLFSHLSLQKKHEKLLYSDDTGFPWIHAQIFCDYIKYK